MEDTKIESVDIIPTALSGACFHGEVWVKCPHCGKAHQVVGWTPLMKKGRYDVYRCDCGKLFKC